MNTIYIRNWVLFNITSPILGIVYRYLRAWAHKHTDVRYVYTARLWSYRVCFTKGFTIYSNERYDHEYLQWLWIRISCDAAGVYHLYVMPIYNAKRRLGVWLRNSSANYTLILMRMRMHYAYRHSFRSGHGVGSFIDHYTHHPYV